MAKPTTYEEIAGMSPEDLTTCFNENRGDKKERKSKFKKTEGVKAVSRLLNIPKPKKAPKEAKVLNLPLTKHVQPIPHWTAAAVVARLMSRKSGMTVEEAQAEIKPKPHPHTHVTPKVLDRNLVRWNILRLHKTFGLGVRQDGTRFYLDGEYTLTAPTPKAEPKPKAAKKTKAPKAPKAKGGKKTKATAEAPATAPTDASPATQEASAQS